MQMGWTSRELYVNDSCMRVKRFPPKRPKSAVKIMSNAALPLRDTGCAKTSATMKQPWNWIDTRYNAPKKTFVDAQYSHAG